MAVPERFVLAGAAVALIAAGFGAAAPAGARAAPSGRGRAIAHSFPSGLPAWLRTRAGMGAGEILAGQRGRGKFQDPVAPTVRVGRNPVAVAVSAVTDTVYVGNSTGTLSVVNGAACNASDHAGCHQRPATVQVGRGPVDAVVDQATNTVYVVGVGSNTASVIDGKTCNAHDSAGCNASPPAVTVGSAPDGVAVDEATHTVYVTNAGGSTVSVINAATCNASDHSGCGQVPPAIKVGPNPFGAAVDQATDTVYVTSATLGAVTSPGSVFVINGATCNGTDHSGCGQSPPKVTVGSIPLGVVLDPASNDVFALSEEDATVSLFAAAACNATHVSGCRKPARAMGVGHNPGYLGVNPATHTLYVSNQNDNTVSVLDTLACTARNRAGCRIAAPVIPVGVAPQGIAADTATGTVYVGNRTNKNLSVVSSAGCNAIHRHGCAGHWPTVAAGPFPQAVAVDLATDTVYTANCNEQANCIGHTVSVIDGATCNAQVTSGCGRAPATVAVGSGPDSLAVNPDTDTIYVANSRSGTVSVINGATCNATTLSGCRHPAALTVGSPTTSLGIDQRTGTVFADLENYGTQVFVLDGARCNARLTSGCHRAPIVVPVGGWTGNLATIPAAHTLYVTDNVDAKVSFFGYGPHGVYP